MARRWLKDDSDIIGDVNAIGLGDCSKRAGD